MFRVLGRVLPNNFYIFLQSEKKLLCSLIKGDFSVLLQHEDVDRSSTNYVIKYYCHSGVVGKSSDFQAGGCEFKSPTDH